MRERGLEKADMPEIRLEQVRKDYYSRKKKIEAVKGIDLCCRDGEFMVFLGPSGCGKTTTMRMIAGLEPITAGSIFIDGKKVNDLAAGERNVALAFENYALYPPLTTRENITFPLKAKKFGRKVIESRLKEVASLLGLEEVLDRNPGRLGGGQQQMVSLARCLIRDAAVYLMDEPLSHLDSDQRFQVRMRLKTLHQKTRRTIIYVTHDQQEALALADRIAVMNDGRLQQLDTPENIYSRPRNFFVADFIGEPPMNFIAGSLFHEGNGFRFQSEDKSLSLPVRAHSLSLPQEATDGESVILGVRPEDISPALSSSEHSVEVVVEVYESLGEEGILEVRCGRNVLVILSKPRLSLRNGQRLTVSINPHKLVLFNPQTEERL
jgi:multiple sugar transport system ATP-binding protein